MSAKVEAHPQKRPVAGAKQVLMETFEPQGFFELVERENVSHVFGVPAIATMLVNHPQAESTDFGSLRQFMLAGAPHPPALVHKMHDLFDCTPVMLWGMTETYRGTVTRLDDDLEVIANTVGSFHPGWEMKIIGPDESELERGQPGELVIRGPWLFREYIKNPRVMEESFIDDGFFKTGDEAVIDGDDRVRITGRIKDLIKRGGVPIAPKEIEDIAYTHPGIRDCALVAMADKRLGEKGCLFVVPETGPQPTLDEIRELLAQQEVAKYKWPERLELIAVGPVSPATITLFAPARKSSGLCPEGTYSLKAEAAAIPTTLAPAFTPSPLITSSLVLPGAACELDKSFSRCGISRESSDRLPGLSTRVIEN